jgi:SpoVK/Ycf46/Vps4 family AAA+-type ATPase
MCVCVCRSEEGAIDFPALAARTDQYSGSDIVLLCKEAAMRPVRRLMVCMCM